MIQNVLAAIASDLNAYFQSHFDTNEDKVLLSNIMDHAGGIEIEDKNKIIVNLINIEEETSLKANRAKDDTVNINLYVLFSAYFNSKNYAEALKFISGVIYYFQSKEVFNSNNTPELTGTVDKITFQLMEMSYHDMSMVYSMLGTKYMPSVVYKLKMLPFNSGEIVSDIPGISGIGLGTGLDDGLGEDAEKKVRKKVGKNLGKGLIDGLVDGHGEVDESGETE